MEELRNAWIVDPKVVKLGSLLGSGSAGEVFSGKWHDMDVAIKTVPGGISEEDWKVLENEIMFLRTLRHPNIVLFFGAGHFSDGMQLCCCSFYLYG